MSAYQKKFVAAVKCNGKILREHLEEEPTVYIPFGSEYSIKLKNLNSRKASVKLSIDGTDVLYGKTLVIDANSEIEIERFLENMSIGNKFKFIEKTDKISNHRGDKIDDGIIRVEFAYEKEINYNISCNPPVEHHHHYHYNQDRWYTPSPFNYPIVYGINNTICKSSADNTYLSMGVGETSVNYTSTSDNGITVKGSKSDQKFKETNALGLLEPSEVIIINIRGAAKNGTVIQKPVTVDTKIECPTCGSTYTKLINFCNDCGTALN